MLDPPPSIVNVGEEVIFTGYLSTEDDEPIEGASISIFGYDDQDNTVLLAEAVTDSSGRFEAVWVAEYLSDAIEVEAFFDGYVGEELEAELELSQSYIIQLVAGEEESTNEQEEEPALVSQGTSILILDPPQSIVNVGEEVIFTGYLSTEDDEPIEGALIEILGYDESENEILLTTGITDTNGEFQATWITPYAGNIEILASFEDEEGMEVFSESYVIELAGEESAPFAVQESATGPSDCLITTATMGSELSQKVQFLQSFRDDKILSTAAGSSFMKIFNAWYYSFSPSVADAERKNTVLQHAIKYAIYPLLAILTVAEKAYSIFEGEAGAVAAGFVTSSMIGFVYLWPIAYGVGRLGRRLSWRILIYAGVASIVAVSVGTLTQHPTALMITTSVFVLIILGIFAIICRRLINGLIRLTSREVPSKPIKSTRKTKVPSRRWPI